jgi:hypothetical protein
MLTKEQVKQIPKSTRIYWNQFKHENCFGYDWSEAYCQQFDDIKAVYSKKFLFRSVKVLCKINESFESILAQTKQRKKILRQNSKLIISQIDLLIQKGFHVKAACKIFHIYHQWYYRQKQRVYCQLSVKKSCFKQQPNQLTISEINSIEQLIKDPVHFGKPLTTLYYHGLNQDLFAFSKSTFFQYAHKLGFKKRTIRKSIPKVGFRATYPFEWLHVDITNVHTTQSGNQKVAFVKDNFSKALLHVKSTSGKAGSKFIRDLFQETFEKYNLFNATHPINILSDGGPENKGELLSWINAIEAPSIVTKITAKTEDFPFSNSMSESTHSIYKSEFMGGKHSFNEKVHLKDLDHFMDYYNNKRFPTIHYGYTVLEVLHGKIPDKHRFKEQINQAKLNRLEVNRAFNQCSFQYCLTV